MAGGTTEIGADISTDTGDQTYNDAVSLTAGVTLTGLSGSGLTCNGTVDGNQDLVLAFGGATSFGSTVGFTNAIGDGGGPALTINSTGTTTFSSTLEDAKRDYPGQWGRDGDLSR